MPSHREGAQGALESHAGSGPHRYSLGMPSEVRPDPSLRALRELASSLVRLLIRLQPYGGVLDVADEASAAVTAMRSMLVRQPTQQKIIADVAQALGTTLSREFPEGELTPGDVTAAAYALEKALEKFEMETAILGSIAAPERLHQEILNRGGSELRSQLGNESAKAVFTLLLTETTRAIANTAPARPDFVSITVPHLLRQDEARQNEIELLQEQSQSHEITLTALVESLSNQESSDDATRFQATLTETTVETSRAVRAFLVEQQVRTPSTVANRETEIGDLRTRVRHDETWWGWRGPPWAGKSTLIASLTPERFPDADIVGFFIVGRDSMANSQAAFLLALIPQLASLIGQATIDIPSEPILRRQQFTGLLEDAGSVCMANGRRLLLLVDGLDEDVSLQKENSIEGSIAALLPAILPPGVVAVVTSRPEPPLPGDVGSSHPLRDERIWHPLSPVPEAQASRTAAEAELRDLISSHVGLALAAFPAAAGAPLTATDLSELLEVDYIELLGTLERKDARSLTSVPSRPNATSSRAYRLGHEKLDEMLVRLLNPRLTDGVAAYGPEWRDLRQQTLEPWRRKILFWATKAYEADWPQVTPEYLLSWSLPQMLFDTEESIEGAVDLLMDERRIDRLFAVDNSYASALSQIRNGITIVQSLAPDSLPQLGRLLAMLELLSGRHDNCPPEAVAVLVKLGQGSRALSISGSIREPSRRLDVLFAVGRAAVTVGNPEWIGKASVGVLDTLLEGGQVDGTGSLDSALRRGGELFASDIFSKSLEQFLEGCEDPDKRRLLLRVKGFTGGRNAAMQPLLEFATSELDEARNLVDVRLRPALLAGDFAEAGEVARAVSQVLDEANVPRSDALRKDLGIVSACTSSTSTLGDIEGIVTLVRWLVAMDAEPAARTLAEHVAWVARSSGKTTKERGGALALTADLLASLGLVERATEQVELALSVAVQVEVAPGCSIGGALAREHAWREIVKATATVGDDRVAEELSHELLGEQGNVEISVGMCARGEELSKVLDLRLPSDFDRARLVSALAEHIWSRPEDAEHLVRYTHQLRDPLARAGAFRSLAVQAAKEVSLLPRARTIVDEIHNIASGCRDAPTSRRVGVVEAAALAGTRQPVRAGMTLARITIPGDRIEALVLCSTSASECGLFEVGIETAHLASVEAWRINHAEARDNYLVPVAGALSRAGRPDFGMDLAGALTSQRAKLEATAQVVGVLGPGRHADARRGIQALRSYSGEFGRSNAFATKVLASAGESLISAGYMEEGEQLLDETRRSAYGLGRSAQVDLEITYARAFSNLDHQRSLEALIAAWIRSGSPWQGWEVLSHLDPNTVRSLSAWLNDRVQGKVDPPRPAWSPIPRM